MSKALERVQNALKADEQRHAVRLKVGAKVDSRNLGLLLDDLGDFRPDVKRGEFKKMFHRMLVINRSLKVGIKRSNLKEWHELSKFRPAADEDHKAFISGILNNFQLMARFTRFLRQSQDFFQKAEEEYLASGRPIGPSEFLNLMAQKLHEAKISTAHLCWHEVVKPLRTHSTNQQIGIDTLKSQLKQLRSDYLKDTKRNGSDPLDAIPDIRYFYEPLHSLKPQEQKFMIDLIREVLKMMMDSDFASGKVKSSALERFVSEAQHFLETQILTGCRSGQSATNTLEKMLNITEEQLAKVRQSFYALQKEDQELQEKYRSLNEERMELVQRLEQEIAENSILHTEIGRLCSVEEEQKQTIQTLDGTILQLKETIQEQQARLDKLMSMRRNVRRGDALKSGANASGANAASGASPDSEGFVQGSHESHHSRYGYRQDTNLFTETDMGFETEPSEPSDRPQEDALGQVEHLQKRIAELEKLLREHLVQLSTLPAQEMQEDVRDLLDRAECIGCQGATHAAQAAQVRLCRCGSVLPDESSYCGKCGVQWSPGAPMSHTCQQLAAEINALAQQIQDAEQVLRLSMAEAGTGGTESCFTMSRILGPPQVEDVSQEELEHRDMLMEQRRNLEDLKKAKLLLETRLLAQRNAELARESGVAAMTALDEEAQAACYCDGVNCQYRRQVEVLQEMVQTLRGLSNEMGEKLQQATGEHLQMTMALTTVQGSLQEAVQVVDQSAQNVDAEPDKAALRRMLTHVCSTLQETKRRSVFWRLYNNRPRSREPGARQESKQKEKRAALVHKTHEHLYKLDSTGPTVSHVDRERPEAVLHVAERSILPPTVPPLPEATANALPTPKQIMLPAIDKAIRSEKSSSKEKNAVPIAAVKLFVEEPTSHQAMAPVFSPRKQLPPTVRRYSKRSGAPSVAMPVVSRPSG